MISGEKVYDDYAAARVAAQIAVEVILYGRSIGWKGSLERRTRVEQLLADYNIAYNIDYTCDLTGTWRKIP